MTDEDDDDRTPVIEFFANTMTSLRANMERAEEIRDDCDSSMVMNEALARYVHCARLAMDAAGDCLVLFVAKERNFIRGEK